MASNHLQNDSPDSQFFDLSERMLNGEQDFKTYWGNLGYWRQDSKYPDACCALANLLANEVELAGVNSILDVGFGSGDQLLLWIEKYGVENIFGINLSQVQTELAKQRILETAERLDLGHLKIDLKTGDELQLPQFWQPDRDGAVSRVLALDCAYHFPERDTFFKTSYQLLQSGGALGLTDVVFNLQSQPRYKRWMLNLMLRAAKVPKCNRLNKAQYESSLQQAGFNKVIMKDISEFVFSPFLNWVENYKTEYETKISKRFGKVSWTKYFVTGRFLEWAHRSGLLSYQVIVASK